MVHEFRESNIFLRASSLTFAVLLSMIPLLAMSTALLKGLGHDNQMRLAAYRFIDQLDPEGSIPGPPLPQQALLPEQKESEEIERYPSLNSHLHEAVDTIFNYVEKTNFAALGAFGIVGLVIVVVMVLSSVENAMNAIWHTRRGRPMFRKIMDYVALLVLLPISINVAVAGDALLGSQKIMHALTAVIPSEWTIQVLLKWLPFFFITLSLMLVYLFFPNVRVGTRAAFCGALFGAVFWFLVQNVYVFLQVGVAQYNAIYGSFAMIPLFLVWIQLGWIFILLGAVLAYAIQNHHHYRLPGKISSPRQRLQQAFDILLTVYNNFALGQTTSEEELWAACPVRNEAQLNHTLDLLLKGRLICETEYKELPAFLPARPPEHLQAAEVVRLIFGPGSENNSVGADFADQVLQAAEQALVAAAFPLSTCPIGVNCE
jgi:membrane protein